MTEDKRPVHDYSRNWPNLASPMAFFRVLVEGSNLRIPGQEGSPGIAGFFTTRVVCAATRNDAGGKALELVRLEWRKPEYSSQPSAHGLVLAVSEVGDSNLLRWLTTPNRGFTFFSE